MMTTNKAILTVVVVLTTWFLTPLHAQVLHLSDIVGGGDGTGTATFGGINPDTGVFASEEDALGDDDVFEDEDGVNPVEVPDSPFVDSVFVLDTTPLAINSSGVEFAFDEVDTYDVTWGHILSNAAQAGWENGDFSVRAGLDDNCMTFDTGVGIHASAGITYDLDALRAEHGDEAVQRFFSFVGHQVTCDCNNITLYAILSNAGGIVGEPYKEHFIWGDPNGEVSMNIPAEASYLTLATGINNVDGEEFCCDGGMFGNARILGGGSGRPACAVLGPTDPGDGTEVTATVTDIGGEPVDLSAWDIVEVCFGDAGCVTTGDGTVEIVDGAAVFTIDQDKLGSDIMDFDIFSEDDDPPTVNFTLANPERDSPFDAVADAFAAGGGCSTEVGDEGGPVGFCTEPPPACLELPTEVSADDEVTVTALDGNGEEFDLSTLEFVELCFGDAGCVDTGGTLDTSSGSGVFTITQEMLDSEIFDFFAILEEGGEVFFTLANPDPELDPPFDTVAEAFAAGGSCPPPLPACIELPTEVSADDEVTVTAFDEEGGEVDLSTLAFAELWFGEDAGGVDTEEENLDTSSGRGVFTITQEMLDAEVFEFGAEVEAGGDVWFTLASPEEDSPFDTVAEAFAAGGNCPPPPPVCLELPTEVSADDEVTVTALDEEGGEFDMSTLAFAELWFGEDAGGVDTEEENLDASSGRGVFTITQEMLDAEVFEFGGEFEAGGDVWFTLASPEEDSPFDTVAEAFAAGGNCEGEPVGPLFRRADANADGMVDQSDATTTLSVLFLGEGEISCRDTADSNDDGDIDISDAIFTLIFLFRGDVAIPPPSTTACGTDPTEDKNGVDLGCEEYPEDKC